VRPKDLRFQLCNSGYPATNNTSVRLPFVELKAQSPALAENDTIVLTYPNGVTLSLTGAIDFVYLKQLITLPTT
jgi:hypothetical protein